MGLSSPRSRVSGVVAGLLALLGFVAEASAASLPRSFPAAGEIVGSSVVARSAPQPNARKVGVLESLRDDFRVQVVFAFKGTQSADSAWVQISLPGRPNGRRGWVPAERLRLKPTRQHIVVYRRARRLELHDGGRRRLRTRIAVGARGMETPLGEFYVTGRFTPKDPAFGHFALETSAYSSLSEWPGGGIVGIHGTNQPHLLGKAVSHGCVRVHNKAARILKRRAPLGTPITITR